MKLRTSARKASSSGEKERSMAYPDNLSAGA
jgi:hypothetical protein